MSNAPEKSPKPNELQCMAKLSSIEDALYVIGGKWKLRIIVALKDGESKRFNELQRTIKGISARVLSNELKDLELNGFVKRIVHAEQFPIVVEYLPTDYCATLSDVIRSLAEWGNKHKKKITAKT
jgi:DNA-binding HxlR family transcriptional regulator